MVASLFRARFRLELQPFLRAHFSVSSVSMPVAGTNTSLFTADRNIRRPAGADHDERWFWCALRD
jgi:hypothetical protein